MRVERFAVIAAACGLLVGCNGESGKEHAPKAGGRKNLAVVHKVEPGPDLQKRTQEILIKVKPGEVVEFGEGRFEYTMGLSLTVGDVTVRGKGIDKTILSFKGQNAGSEGLLSKDTDKVVFEDFTIEDPKGDGIKVQGGDKVVFRRMGVVWTGGGKETNGAYGIYPVQCKNVLIEDCLAVGASDAGVYVGQSQNVIVRGTKARQNVVGLEIENTLHGDLYHCEATDNSCGILITDLPDLPVKNGGRVRVFANKVYANNHPNFGPKGAIVGQVPPGTGIMVMAMDHVEVFDNEISDNQTANLALISYLATGRPIKDKEYDPFCEGLFVHGNRFSGGGQNPKGSMAEVMGVILGKTFPDIVYDGIVNPQKAPGGKLPPELALVLRDNGDATFADVRMMQQPQQGEKKEPVAPERDPKKYAGDRPSLPPVKLEGID